MTICVIMLVYSDRVGSDAPDSRLSIPGDRGFRGEAKKSELTRGLPGDRGVARARFVKQGVAGGTRTGLRFACYLHQDIPHPRVARIRLVSLVPHQHFTRF